MWVELKLLDLFLKVERTTSLLFFVCTLCCRDVGINRTGEKFNDMLPGINRKLINIKRQASRVVITPSKILGGIFSATTL